MITISLFNQKGGVGKTTLTVNLASCLSRYFKKKILIVDADAQCNTSSYMLATTDDRPDAMTVYDLIKKDKADIIPITIRKVTSKATRNYRTTISLLKGDARVDMLDGKNVTLLRDRLQKYSDDYDICLLDMSPQKTAINLYGLCASDHVLVPCNLDPDSLHGFDMARELCEDFRTSQNNTSLDIIGVVINDMDTCWSIDKYLHQVVRDELSDVVFETPIRHSSAVATARFMGYPVDYLVPRSKDIAMDYYSTAEELLSRLENNKVGK